VTMQAINRVANVIFLISNFRRVLSVVCFLLGNSDAGELPRRKHTTSYSQQTAAKNSLGLKLFVNDVIYGYSMFKLRQKCEYSFGWKTLREVSL